MVYAFIQDVPVDEEFYRRVLDGLGPEPLAGSLLHLCVRRPEGGLRYIDVWETEQAFHRAMTERVLPAVDAAFGGSRPPGEPDIQVLEVLDATGALLARTPG
jgi:hypothetical protein